MNDILASLALVIAKQEMEISRLNAALAQAQRAQAENKPSNPVEGTT